MMNTSDHPFTENAFYILSQLLSRFGKMELFGVLKQVLKKSI